MKRRLLVAALVACATLAQADPVVPAPAVGAQPTLSPADAAKLVGFFDKVLDAMVARKADCARVAGAIDDLVTRNAPMLRGVMKQLQKKVRTDSGPRVFFTDDRG